jgi:EEF1A lysine methyltransferase 1
MVVIDPPFITEQVWEMYAKAVEYLLLKDDGSEDGKNSSSSSSSSSSNRRILCTTVAEKADLLQALLGVEERRFQPSIPKLVYQFSSFSNYESARLNEINPELL